MKNTLLTPTNLYKEAERRLRELTKIKQFLEKRLNNTPEGKIHVVTSTKRTQYYLRLDSKDKSGKYIPKGQEKLIKQLMQKKYDEETLKLINKEIKKLEKLLNNSSYSTIAIQKLYSDSSLDIKTYLEPIDISNEDYIKAWLSIPYEAKPIYDESKAQKTENGEFVRSKSELNIANCLIKMKIPYKYECPLTLSNGYTIHPDFTVLDVKRRKIVYWEHRGMMDDREYAKNSVIRLHDYSESGIMLGDNLIITEETASHPLSISEIERTIKFYFKGK